MASVPPRMAKRSSKLQGQSGAPPFSITSGDQDALFQLGLQTVFDRAPDLRWAGASNDGNSVLAHCHRTRPDILLLDSRLDVGGDLIRAAMSSPAIGTTIVLVANTELTRDRIHQLAEYGATFILDRSIPPAYLADRIVHYHSKRHAVTFLTRTPPPGRRSDEELTRRELQMLGFVSLGLTNHEIAEEQSISTETVRSHVKSMLSKLGARNRAHAVTLGHLHNLIGMNPAHRPAPEAPPLRPLR